MFSRSHDSSDTGEEEDSSDEWEDKSEPSDGEDGDFRNEDGTRPTGMRTNSNVNEEYFYHDPALFTVPRGFFLLNNVE